MPLARYHASPMSSGSKQPEPAGFDPAAGLLAFLFPGAGHMLRGQSKRGLYIAVGVLGLFLGGLLIGGLSVVDRKSPRLETRLSFYGQMFVGPVAVAADFIHQTRFKGWDEQTRTRREALPGEVIRAGKIEFGREGDRPPMRRSLGKMNEIGVLYALVAGMINFIAILDALFPTLRRQEKDRVSTSGAIDAVLAAGGTKA